VTRKGYRDKAWREGQVVRKGDDGDAEELGDELESERKRRQIQK
jgi:hypothetical protein